MFIKFMYYSLGEADQEGNRKARIEREVLYHCCEYSIDDETAKRSDGKWAVTFTINGGIYKEITVVEDENRRVEVYVTNSDGKTIERYIY